MLAPIQRSSHPSLYAPKNTRNGFRGTGTPKSKSLSYLHRAQHIEAQLNRNRSQSEGLAATGFTGVSEERKRHNSGQSLSRSDEHLTEKESKSAKTHELIRRLPASHVDPGTNRNVLKTPPQQKEPVMKGSISAPSFRSRGRSDSNELRKYIATRRLQALQSEAERDGVKINVKYPLGTRRRSLSEGSLPLSVIVEEPEKGDSRRHKNFLKRCWRKIKSLSRSSESGD